VCVFVCFWESSFGMNIFREPANVEYSLADLARLKEENSRKITITKLWIEEYWSIHEHYMSKYQPTPDPPQVRATFSFSLSSQQ